MYEEGIKLAQLATPFLLLYIGIKIASIKDIKTELSVLRDKVVALEATCKERSRCEKVN